MGQVLFWCQMVSRSPCLHSTGRQSINKMNNLDMVISAKQKSKEGGLNRDWVPRRDPTVVSEAALQSWTFTELETETREGQVRA